MFQCRVMYLHQDMYLHLGFFNNSALLQNNNPVSIKLLTFHGSEQTQKGMQAMMYRHTKSNVWKDSSLTMFFNSLLEAL